MTWTTFALILLTLISCRSDPAVDSQLEWSCVRMQKNAAPIATPECLDQLKKENSVVLKHYNAVPFTENGKLIHFAIIERAQPRG